MALNFCKIFEFPNANGLQSLVIVTEWKNPKIPPHLHHYEIVPFDTMEEARKFGREFVLKNGKECIVPHALNVEDFFKYTVVAFPTGASAAYGNPVQSHLTFEEASSLADKLHFEMQDAVDECGAGFFASHTFSVIMNNE